MINDPHSSVRLYAEDVVRSSSLSGSESLPLVAHARGVPRNPEATTEFYQFNGLKIDDILDHFPHDLLLLGTPGAGKSYSVKRFHDRSCRSLLESFDLEDQHLPEFNSVTVFVDLKLYQGDFEQLLSRSCPFLDIAERLERQDLSFVVDSFNECPRQFLENGQLVSDLLSWVNATPDCRWIITSRTEEGLDFFDGERFEIIGLEKKYVEEKLNLWNIDTGQRHRDDMLELLCKPLFFAALEQGRLRLTPGGTHPAAAIEAVVESFLAEIPMPRDIAAARLGSVAVNCIHSGDELIPLDELIDALVSTKETSSETDPEAARCLSQLLDSEFLLEYSDQRISFYHQSITEWLAAKSVSGLISRDIENLNQLLSSTRWDHVLQLVTHYLDPELNALVFRRIVEKDVSLAARMARFSEFDRTELVSQILEVLLELGPDYRIFDYGFDISCRTLPVDTIHAQQLRKLLKYPAGRGGTAAILLCRALGQSAVPDVIEAVFNRPENYNLGQDAGKAVDGLISDAQLKLVWDRIVECESTNPEYYSGAARFFAMVLDTTCNSETIIHEFHQRRPDSHATLKGLAEWAGGCKDQTSFEFLVELVSKENAKAVFWLYLRVRHENEFNRRFPNLDRETRREFLQALRRTLRNPKCSEYSIELIGLISALGNHYRLWVEQILERSDDLISAAMLSVIKPFREADFIERMSRVTGDSQLGKVDSALLQLINKVEWPQRDLLLRAALNAGNTELVFGLINRVGFPVVLSCPIDWSEFHHWLAWYSNAIQGENKFLRHRYPEFVKANAGTDLLPAMLREFNDSNSDYRDLLAEHFLIQFDSIEFDHFSTESREFLLTRLEQAELYERSKTLLGSTATPDYIEKHLLPLKSRQDQPLSNNLGIVLRACEKRLRIRY